MCVSPKEESRKDDQLHAQKEASYGNENITSLKGADRVRKRPAVIFGSDGAGGLRALDF